MKRSSKVTHQEKATVVPYFPINGVYPTLKGVIYREPGDNGLVPNEHFVADDGQGISEWDSVIHEFRKAQQ